MMIKSSRIISCLLIFVCCGADAIANGFKNGDGGKDIINIGVVVDMGSGHGKYFKSIIEMAVKDFYNENGQYQTRISLHIRNSGGDSLRSIASAINLLESVKVHALIVPCVSNMELFMATLADKANVPLLSFPAITLSDEHPYYLQVAPDETSEFHGIAAISQTFNWKHCAILYEDTVNVATLYNILQDNNIHVTHQTPLSLSATNDQIFEKLHDIVKKGTSIVVIHLSPSLASQVFRNAKTLGMMVEGFAWIATSKAMNLLNLQDSSVHELMQGVLGFRPYITSSGKLQNFLLRLKRVSSTVTREYNLYGVWAYDAVWSLALATEREGIKPHADDQAMCNLLDSDCLMVNSSGQALLTKILSGRFIGLDGVFELKNRKLVHDTYEIVNVIGNGERRVGFWRSSDGLFEEIYRPSNNISSNTTLETIIWPGISVTTPASQLGQTNGKHLRVAIPSRNRIPEMVNWQHDQETNVTTADGYCIEVFRAAFNWLQYDISIEFIPFNGTYNDLVNQVYLQRYDGAVGDITILPNRSKFVDFTSTFSDIGVGMMVRLDDTDPWFFTKPLDLGLWIICGCWFVATGTIVWLVEHSINEEFQGSFAQQIGTLLWFSASTLVFAHRERLKSNISKFVVSIWLFVVLILTSSYTANLSSLLTVQSIKLMKSDHIGSASPLVEGQTITNLNFQNNMLRYRTPGEYFEGLRRGSKKGGVGAIVDEMPYIKYIVGSYPNEFTIVQTSMTTSGFGFAFPKGSSFVPELSRAISGLRQEGRLLEIEKKWFAGHSPMLPQDNQPPSVNALSIKNFCGLFLISGISTMLAALLLFFIFLRGKLFRMRTLAVNGWILILGKFHPRMTRTEVSNDIREFG